MQQETASSEAADAQLPSSISTQPQGQQDAAPLLPQPTAVGQPPPGAVLHGTCGWSDATLVRCGRFYPPGVKPSSSSEDKLRHYSRRFPCVEVDTSTYAIPQPDVTLRWAHAAAPGFLFHVKAFGLFCSQGCQVSSLPREARALLAPAQQAQPQQHLRLSAMGPAVVGVCWRRFHAALEPLYQAGKLGLVVFQFHLGFSPSQTNLQYVLRCRSQLDPRFRMAVELRCRAWFTDPTWRQQLCEALRMQGVTLVAADELVHETVQRDREQTGLPPGEARQVLPIALEVTTPECAYVRVHRRHGTTERRLPAEEIQAWAARLKSQLAPALQGPCYFLWGTDWEDAPVVNARSLDEALPATLRFDWHERCGPPAPVRGSIQSLFAQQQRRQQEQQQQQVPPGASRGSADRQLQDQQAAGGMGTTPPGHQQPGTLPSVSAGVLPGRKRPHDGAAPGTDGKNRRGSGSGGILRFLQRHPQGDG